VLVLDGAGHRSAGSFAHLRIVGRDVLSGRDVGEPCTVRERDGADHSGSVAAATAD
jgi:hypothetical protein